MTPDAYGDLAENLVPIAGQLVGAVHDEGVGAVARVLSQVHPDHMYALAVVLAAMVDPDSPPSELLGWVTWDDVPAYRQDSLLSTACDSASSDPTEWTDEECKQRHRKQRSGSTEYLDYLGYLEWERRRKRASRARKAAGSKEKEPDPRADGWAAVKDVRVQIVPPLDVTARIA